MCFEISATVVFCVLNCRVCVNLWKPVFDRQESRPARPSFPSHLVANSVSPRHRPPVRSPRRTACRAWQSPAAPRRSGPHGIPVHGVLLCRCLSVPIRQLGTASLASAVHVFARTTTHDQTTRQTSIQTKQPNSHTDNQAHTHVNEHTCKPTSTRTHEHARNPKHEHTNRQTNKPTNGNWATK